MALHQSAEYGCADAVMLASITEGAFVENLKLRFSKNKIYTYIGEVVISVNPYCDMGLYTDAILREHVGKALYQREPHIYALAEAAYTTMRRTEADCCVMISGESGAGKTEASKHVMRYVAAVSTAKQKGEIEHIKNMLLASNPVLEAFGNAKTNRNDNSSRFGKYMEINFDFKFEPAGGNIHNYLLEKARVVKQQAGERNFHIFYQLLAGASDQLLDKLKLTRDPRAFTYLSQGGDAVVPGMNDKANFAEVQKAAHELGLDNGLMDTLYTIVAAVIHIGQVKFEAVGDACKVSSSLATLASLLNIAEAELTKALTIRVVAARGEVFETKLTAEAAAYARDALAKAVYDRLFSNLVAKINERIAVKHTGGDTKAMTMGVLDIYGFEIFPSNGFEQFCINYCNEKLQQLFIELVMKREQEEYATEGITWVEVPFFDNAAICAMVENPKNGVIAILDEQCARPNGSDKAFLAHLDAVLKGDMRYSSRQKDPNDTKLERERDFRVFHFAGEVAYTTGGFVDKNNDSLFQDLKRLLYSCGVEELKAMFPEGADKLTDVHKNPLTAATNFKNSMSALVQLLGTKNPYYVRCIKPNDAKAANTFSDELALHQVRYLGLMENLRVRRAGYCNRQLYPVFNQRYKMLSKQTWPNYHRLDEKSAAKAIITALNLDDQVAFGHTKIFIKEPKTLLALEAARDAAIPRLVSKIQATWKAILQRRKYIKMRAVYRIVSYWFKSKSRRFVAKLAAACEPHLAAPDYGKSIQWPAAPPAFADFVLSVQKIQNRWRAERILKRYTPEQTVQLRRKVLAAELLSGRREQWGYQYTWAGNYVAKGPNAEKFGASMVPLMDKHGCKKILFSDVVTKLSTSGKSDERILVVTDKHIYKLDAKSCKIHKTPLPLDTVAGFAVSSGEDQALVIKFTNGGTDLVVNLHGDACAAEIIVHIAQSLDKTLPVDVDKKVQVNIKGKKQNISFATAGQDKTAFKRRASGFALVTKRDSMARILARRGAELTEE